MLTLNDETKQKLAALSARVSKYEKQNRKINKLIPWFVLGLIICVAIQYFSDLGLSSIHIPASLLKAKELAAAGIETQASDLADSPPVKMIILMLFIWAGFEGLVRGSYLTMGIILVIVISLRVVLDFVVSEDVAPQYNNQGVVSAIVNHDMSKPIDQGYITKVNTLDERYILAQAAVLSQAHYPVDFFKAVAEDLKTGASGLFVPEFRAQHAIEVAAYGLPITPRIIDRESLLSTSHSIAKTLAQIIACVSWVLVVASLSLLMLRWSINVRLKAIDELVAKHGADSGKGAV